MFAKIWNWLKSFFNSKPSQPALTPTELVVASMTPKTIRLGDTGVEVSTAQTKLVELKLLPTGSVDGQFGGKTELAVRKFQTAWGLTSDGVVGPLTWTKLMASVQPAPPLPTPVPVPTPGGDLSKLSKGTPPWYDLAYRQMTFDKGFESAILRAAQRVLSGKSRYQKVEAKLGVPWYVVGGIHNMEASCNFAGCLQNGEHIIGTGRKTTLVPKGRGPFATWEDSADDALSGWRGYTWELGVMLKRVEAYNGTGYLNNHREENTPYLWAETSINDGHGKYVADGHYDPNADSNQQVGFAAILKQLELLGEIKLT